MAEFISTGLGGLIVKPSARRVSGASSGKADARSYERDELLPPPRSTRNIVPDETTVQQLLDRALIALAQGYYWDRGSIVNLLL